MFWCDLIYVNINVPRIRGRLFIANRWFGGIIIILKVVFGGTDIFPANFATFFNPRFSSRYYRCFFLNTLFTTHASLNSNCAFQLTKLCATNVGSQLENVKAIKVYCKRRFWNICNKFLFKIINGQRNRRQILTKSQIESWKACGREETCPRRKEFRP